jgi:Domain of unknown function DUF83
MDKQTFLKVIIGADDERPRSQQTEIGVSQLGGCRRQVWLQLQGTPKTNTTLRLASWMGTAIHDSIERSFKRAIEKGDVSANVLIEHRIESANGLPPATVDFYDPETKTITDWKSIKLMGIPYFGKLQQRYQVNTYAYIFNQNGLPVEFVQLFGIPRDGTENELVDTWIEPYNEATALEALAWLEEVKNAPFAPEPEKDATFCQNYCEYFGSACGGISKEFPAGEPISDPVATQAALDYKSISDQIKELTDKKEAARAALEGVNGVTFDGISVKWSSSTTSVVDKEAIEKALGSVPTKQGATSERLTVK